MVVNVVLHHFFCTQWSCLAGSRLDGANLRLSSTEKNMVRNILGCSDEEAQLYRVALWRLYHILENLLQFLPLFCYLSGSCLILPVFAWVVILHQLRYIFLHHKKVSFVHKSLKKHKQWKNRKKYGYSREHEPEMALSSCSRVLH